MKRADGAVVAHPLFQEEEDGSTPISALDLKLVKVGMRLAQDLNRQWHSILPRTDLGNLLCGNTSVAYAAEYRGRFYAIAIWSQPIIHALCDGETIELRRLAISGDAPPNTASRMLGVMRRLLAKEFPQMRKMISYLAVDQHSGTIYKAAGWKAVGEVVAARPQRFSNVNPNTRATAPLQTHSRKQRYERII